jgi:effector-binding domain-containing protein
LIPADDGIHAKTSKRERSGLPEASGRAWSAIAAKKTPLRDDFAIEHYLNDPKETPPEQLITEILLPME